MEGALHPCSCAHPVEDGAHLGGAVEVPQYLDPGLDVRSVPLVQCRHRRRPSAQPRPIVGVALRGGRERCVPP